MLWVTAMGMWVPLQFRVSRHGDEFLDGSVGEALSALMAIGKVEAKAPVRVMLLDTEGATWGSRSPLFMVEGTAGEFAPGKTLKKASDRWPAHLRRFGIEPKFSRDLDRCVVEVPHRP